MVCWRYVPRGIGMTRIIYLDGERLGDGEDLEEEGEAAAVDAGVRVRLRSTGPATVHFRRKGGE